MCKFHYFWYIGTRDYWFCFYITSYEIAMITSRMWDHLLKDALFMLSIIRNIISFLIFFGIKMKVWLPFHLSFAFYFSSFIKEEKENERVRRRQDVGERGRESNHIVSGDLFIVVNDDNWVFYHFSLKLQRFKVNKQHKIIVKVQISFNTVLRCFL